MRKAALALFAAALLAATPVLAQNVLHVVQPGENLFRIAQFYSLDVAALAQANGITNTWQIYSGQQLIIPSAVPAVVEIAAAPARATQTHTVSRGENMTYIAQLYAMTPQEIATLNNLLNPNLIYAGQALTVYGAEAAQPVVTEPVQAALSVVPPDVPASAVPSGIYYTVQSGEYLSQIAERFGMSSVDIAQANAIYDPNTVYAGQSLYIPGVAGDGYSAQTDGVYNYMDMIVAPAPIYGVGREIIVDLGDQMTYAYENGVLVRTVLASTGLPATPTVLGDYTIDRKYVAQTMSGPDYYLPDVPYVMYFYQGYAFHGTYWHNNFGQPMSHGCVNLPTPEAEWFYNWADFGTPVHVQM